MEQPPTKNPLRRRRLFLLITWLIALVAAAFPELGYIGFVWMFPLGLLKFTDWNFGAVPDSIFYFLFWIPYIALTAIGFFTRKRTIYLFVYGVLCVMLLLNVVGCRAMIDSLNHIR